MARNKLTDLNDHLFAQLERLNDDNLKVDEIDNEVKKAKAITGIASQIIKSSKIALDAMKLVGTGTLRDNEIPESFGLKKLNQIND